MYEDIIRRKPRRLDDLDQLDLFLSDIHDIDNPDEFENIKTEVNSEFKTNRDNMKYIDKQIAEIDRRITEMEKLMPNYWQKPYSVNKIAVKGVHNGLIT